VAAQVEPKSFEFQQRLVGFRLRGRRERFGHAREQLGFVAGVHEIIRSRALAAGGRDDENPAHRGPQFLERDAFASVETFGADDRERNPLEASAAGMRKTLGDLGAIAIAARETRQATPQIDIPSYHHNPVAHRTAVSVVTERDHCSPIRGGVTSLLHSGDRGETSSAHAAFGALCLNIRLETRSSNITLGADDVVQSWTTSAKNCHE
jgi:hypothetical protein